MRDDDDFNDPVLRGVAAAPAQRSPSSFRGTDRFALGRRLGEGTFGVVYEAFDRKTGSQVALKVLRHATPEWLYRFKREFRALPDLSHPNVVRIYELDQAGDDWFFAMELVEGESFLRWVQGATERLRPAIEQLARGVAALHMAGLVHCDLKPSNVLVTREGRVVLVDFGLASFSAADNVSDSMSGGTPIYMAPEQVVQAAVGPPADWYAVGVMLYEALAGVAPFTGSVREVLSAKLRGVRRTPLEIAEGVPDDLGRLSMDLLHTAPQERPTGSEVRARLATGGGGRVDPASDATVRREPFVGRSDELRKLEALRDGTRSGRPAVMLLHGPSGIGKTALAARFVDQLRNSAANPMVIAGRCFEQEFVPFKALDSLIDDLVRQIGHLEPITVRSVMPRDVAALARLFPVLRRVSAMTSMPERPEPSDAQQLRRRGSAALRELLARLCEHRPLVLLIDDLQWGDVDSVSLIAEIIKPPGPPSLMLLAIHRSDEEGRSPCLRELLPLLRTAASAGRLTLADIALPRLSTAEAQEAAMATLAEPDGERANLIARESEGWPFFIRQMALFAAPTVAAPAVGADVDATPLLDRTIATRIGSLPMAARELLDVLAVAGRPLDRALARRVMRAGAGDMASVAVLRSERLTRSQILDDQEQIDTYHDRIREVALTRIPSERRRRLHLDLGGALAGADADPGLLAWHFHEGGSDDVASDFAIAAGDQAMHALAFETAARHYGLAVTWHAGDEEREARLSLCRAEALANAGRGAEAGPLFLALAGRAKPERSLDLRRAAVEQLLVSGIIEHGVKELQSLAADVRLPFPRSSVAALFAMVRLLLVLWWSGTLGGRARRTAVSLEEARRADVAGSAFRGLLPVLPAQAGYFAVAELAHARHSSDPRRLALSLAGVGSGVLCLGPRWLARVGERLVDLASQHAEGDHDPYLRGFVSLARGSCAFLDAHWADALARVDEGAAVLALVARRSAHEWNLAQLVAIRSLEELGQWPAARARSEDMYRDAVDRGDLYSEVTACLNIANGCLALGESVGARRWADRVLARWPRGPESLQYIYALRVQCYCDLHDDEPAMAWKRLTAAWPDIKRGMHLATRPGRVDLLLLRGRIALRYALGHGAVRRARLREVHACARGLAATGRLDAVAHAAQLRAGAAAITGRADECRRQLEAAALHYRRLGMDVYAACASLRLRGSGAEAEYELSSLVAHGIAEPRTWAGIYAPGFADDGAAAASAAVEVNAR